MSVRYYKYNFVLHSFLISKSHNYIKPSLVKITNVNFSIGHLKLGNLYPEHGLIFIGLSTQKPVLNFFVHGKRLQKTVVLSTILNSEDNIYAFIDRFINVILPCMHDLRMLKFKRHSSGLYTWHLKKYFEWEEIDGFISDRLLTKTFLLPMVLQLKISGYSLDTQNFLRMLRFPFVFYKNAVPSTSDDFI